MTSEIRWCRFFSSLLIAVVLVVFLSCLLRANLFSTNKVVWDKLFAFSIGFCLLVALGLEHFVVMQNSQSSSSSSTVNRSRKRSSSQSSMSSTASSTKSGGGRRTSKIRRPRRRLRKEAAFAPTASASTNNVYFLALFFILLAMFALKTWSRNHDWNSRRGLFKYAWKIGPW